MGQVGASVETLHMRETDLAAAVVRWLTHMEWTVHQEVSLGAGARTVDLVATRGPLVWALECKVRLGLAVLAQAYGLLGHAHYVSVAVAAPAGGDTASRWFAERVVAADHGIGVIEVEQWCNEDDAGREWVAGTALAPQLWRRVRPFATHGAVELYRKLRPLAERTDRRAPYLRDLLTPQQRCYAPAGNNRGQRWSPWQGTCAAVQEYVQAHPGCTAAECMGAIKHHYRAEATARSSMVQWVRAGKVPGVEERCEDGKIRWWEAT